MISNEIITNALIYKKETFSQAHIFMEGKKEEVMTEKNNWPYFLYCNKYKHEGKCRIHFKITTLKKNALLLLAINYSVQMLTI